MSRKNIISVLAVCFAAALIVLGGEIPVEGQADHEEMSEPASGMQAEMGAGEAAAAEPRESVAEICAACHSDVVEAFQTNPHAVLDRPDWMSEGTDAGSCTDCHGDPTEHLENGGGAGTIYAFSFESSGLVRAERCLTCHKDQFPRYQQTVHMAADVDCGHCHSAHYSIPGAPALLKVNDLPERDLVRVGSPSAVCLVCHGDVGTQFQFNERHRLQENIMECQSCHNNHAPEQRMMLGGFKQQACIDCHTDKGGPFVFEHGASRVESCVACHTPHGSPNRHLLNYQRTAELCYSCHVSVPGFHSRFTLETNCVNCHSSIHGSNLDPHFLK